MSSLEPVAQNFGDCPLCQKLFSDPRQLPCYHSCCLQCLQQWVVATPNPPCPVCSAPIPSPPSPSHESWQALVDDLPRARCLEALVHSLRVLGQGRLCVGCRRTRAMTFCLQCGDVFCAFCSDVHLNSTTTRHHNVTDLPALDDQQLDPSKPANCCIHQNKPAELFCLNHNEALCQECAASNHRKCPDVSLFAKQADQLQSQMANMAQKLKTAKAGMEKGVRQLQQFMSKAMELEQSVLKNIHAGLDRIEKAVKDCRRRLIQEAKTSVTKIKDNIKTAMTSFLSRMEEVGNQQASVKRCQRSTPPKFMYEVTNHLQSQMQNLDLSSVLPPDVHVPSLFLDEKAVQRILTELNDLPLLSILHAQTSIAGVAEQDVDRWAFHLHHGVNAVLSGDRHTASWIDSNEQTFDGIVLSAQPMEPDVIYEVEVLETEGYWFVCGALLTGSVTDVTLPDNVYDGWEGAVVFSHALYDQFRENVGDLEDRMDHLPRGTRVALMLDKNYNVHLMLNDEDIAQLNVPARPCHAFFQLDWAYTKLKAGPVKKL